MKHVENQNVTAGSRAQAVVCEYSVNVAGQGAPTVRAQMRC